MKTFLPTEKLDRVFSSRFDAGLLFVGGSTLASCAFLAIILSGRSRGMRADVLALVVVLILGAAWGVLAWIKMRAEARARKVAQILASGRVSSVATDDGMICLKADTARNFDLGTGTQRISAVITAKLSVDELERLQSVIDASNRSTVFALPSGDRTRDRVVDVEEQPSANPSA